MRVPLVLALLLVYGAAGGVVDTQSRGVEDSVSVAAGTWVNIGPVLISDGHQPESPEGFNGGRVAAIAVDRVVRATAKLINCLIPGTMLEATAFSSS